jgi:hypothetical protein
MAAASSMRAAGTSMREGALHDWPELLHMAAMSREITLAKSASSRMMFADLPPSSCATRLTVGAAARATSTPARVEPVNDTMSTSGWAESAAPTPAPSPLTRLNTPAGTPASSRISVKMIAFSGATSDGLSTIVQPAASAGATLQAIWLIGQFHGVISAHTPTGSRTTSVVPISCSNSKSASILRAVVKWAMPAVAWARLAIHSGAPISWLMTSAISSTRDL